LRKKEMPMPDLFVKDEPGSWRRLGSVIGDIEITYDDSVVDPVDRTEEIRDRDDSGRHRYAKRDDSTKLAEVNNNSPSV